MEKPEEQPSKKLSKSKIQKVDVTTEPLYYSDLEEEDYTLNPPPNITIKDSLNFIYDFNKVDKPYMQPKEATVSLEDRYYTACYLTSNLSCEHFLKNIKNKNFKMEYYDSPFHEFHVQSLFLENISSIEIVDVDLNLDFFIHLVEKKQMFNNVTNIVLQRCNINEDMLAIFCPDLESAFSMILLDLSENPIGDNGFKHILLYLYDWTSLKTLILFDTQLSGKSFETLGGLYLERRLFLNVLNLSRNMLNKQISVKKFLSPFSKKKPPLDTIVLNHCGISGFEVSQYFNNYLKNVKSLKSLDLSFNLFSTEEEALSLGNLLMESFLQLLNLSYNFFNERSLLSLIDCLFAYPPSDNKKTLVIENFTIPQKYLLKNPSFLKRSDIIVKHAGIRNLAVKEIDDMKKILVKRLHHLYKKSKPKKDLVVETIKENIPRRRLAKCKPDDFKDALSYIPSDDIDSPLIQQIVEEFCAGGSKANALLFINIYEELYPTKFTKKSNVRSTLKQPNGMSEQESLRPSEHERPSELSSKNA